MVGELQICIRNARLSSGDLADIGIVSGRIASDWSEESARENRADILDATGYVALPALVEPHVHLDKTLWGEPWRPNTAGPTIPEYIANERQRAGRGGDADRGAQCATARADGRERRAHHPQPCRCRARYRFAAHRGHAGAEGALPRSSSTCSSSPSRRWECSSAPVRPSSCKRR